jgi:transcriptional regulator with XRE-family HTH domain
VKRLNASAVGRRIRRLREQRGMSQRELSFDGVSYAYISRLEHGQRTPSLTALAGIAEKLGASPVYLATGHEDAACPFCGRK